MEENRRFSWTDLFIKVILVAIFVLFTVWLLSLSNQGLSNSLDVLTNNIFSENIEKMKNVGKEYFTIERLPKKVGDVKTLTLEKMYEKKLLLELNDKDGNACSAKNSYISIEKYDNEYQMKVYLECGEENDYIIVIMGCYDYCDTDICELDTDKEEARAIEYEYKKTTGGSWSDWGKWTNWSKVSVTENKYRDVETKVEEEEYSYDKTTTEIKYTEFEASCPQGYKMTSDKTKCYKVDTTYEYANPVCQTLSGWSAPSRNGFTCTYTKTVVKATKDPICPSKSGWTYTGRNGFTCNYKKTTTVTSTTEYDLKYVQTKNYTYRPSSNSTYYYKVINVDYQYSCNTTCSAQTIYTVEVYKKVYKTTTTTDTTTASASCPSGSTKVDNKCVVYGTDTTTKAATCPSRFSQSGNSCAKPINKNVYTDLIKSCPAKYAETSDGTQCYKEVSATETVTETRKVTYYRYRLREYIGGTTDYKWSTSKNDKKLLNAGYKLTGRTR